MATITSIESALYGANGVAYQRGTDWTDDGDGTFTSVPGSALATYLAAAGSVDYITTSYSDTEATTDLTHRLDASYSGIWLTATPGGAAGTAIPHDVMSVHLTEYLASNQSTFRWQSRADAASSVPRDVAIAHHAGTEQYILVRIGTIDYAGTTVARDEWRFVLTVADPVIGENGERQIRFEASDYSQLIRAVSTDGIPTEVRAHLNQLPDEDDGTQGIGQATVGGPQAYMLSHLIDDITPSGVTVQLAAPDILIERLPDTGDALDMLAAACNAGGYYARWDGDVLIIDQFEPLGVGASCVLTSGHVFEARREEAAGTRSYDSVRIERPGDFGDPADGGLQPNRDGSPQGSTGAIVRPSEAEANSDSSVDGDVTIYRALFTWEPPQQYLEQPPAPVMLAFGDTQFAKAGYTGLQLYSMLQTQPGQLTMTPALKYTPGQVNGYNGLDWYFLVDPDYVKIRVANDYIDGWIVSRSGYYTDTGSVTRSPLPIANALVRVTGQDTGTTYEVTTNAAGYWRVDNAEPDRYFVSVYLDDDSYLANKSDAWTDGHPYDDDPTNDETGPDNSDQFENIYQVLPTIIDFRINYRTGREVETETPSDFEVPNMYRARGGFTYGTADGDELLIEGLGDMLLDPANVTSDQQARGLAEKMLGSNSESRVIYVVSKPFGGQTTKAGNVVRLDTTTDVPIDDYARVMVREIRVKPGGLVAEALSTHPDSFVDDAALAFAEVKKVRDANRAQTRRVLRLESQIAEVKGRALRPDQLGRDL